MTQIADSKKRKYSLKMQDKYNEMLKACAKPKTVNELSFMFSKTNSHIRNWVETLQMNNHVNVDFIPRNLGGSLVLALSKCVPEHEFSEEYKPRSRRTTPETGQVYKWAGNPFRETIV